VHCLDLTPISLVIKRTLEQRKTSKQSQSSGASSIKMKAIQFTFRGEHSFVEIPKPVPATDEVLVKVINSALDTSVLNILKKTIVGYFIHALTEPLYLGYHYSGTVEAIGSGVIGLNPGEAVFGHLQYTPNQTQGTFAEYVKVKRSDCAVKPQVVSHAIAAASTTGAITALQGMRDLGGLGKGQRILIVGAGGAVGSSAVQIAKVLGASCITAICSTKDVEQVRHWGADSVLDRSVEPDIIKKLCSDAKPFDVIFDTANALPTAATRLLAPKGVLVNTVPTPTFVWNKIKLLFSSKEVGFINCHSKAEDLTLIGKWLEEGDLSIPIDSTYPVKDIEAAIKKQQASKKGRVVINVADGWN
jgi:NADPH:quinone reductase-like Zn-dependent oxidoreductase